MVAREGADSLQPLRDSNAACAINWRTSMHLARYIERLRRGSVLVVLGVVVAVIALSVTQCRMVGDQLTGVSVSPTCARSCLQKCDKVWDDSTRVERQLHLANLDRKSVV
jgi:hypothetical protein